jgi:hypothetical protein
MEHLLVPGLFAMIAIDGILLVAALISLVRAK